MSREGFMEELTLEVGIRKEEAGKKAASPRGWGHILGWGPRGTQPPMGLSWAERVVAVPDLS